MDQDAIDSTNAQLKQLALQAQAAPQGSLPRRIALDQLIRALQNCQLLYKLPYGKCPPQLMYQEVCDIAIQRLFCYVCKNIDKYKPNYEVTQWVNFLLKKRFFWEAIDELLSKLKRSELKDLEPPPQSPSLTELIIEHIKSDSEQCLSQVHIRDRPDVTAKVIALRILAGYTLREISAEFDIPITTLCTFYNKHLKRCAPTIKTHILQ